MHIEVNCLLVCLEGYVSLGVGGYLEVKEIDILYQIRSFPGELQAGIIVFFVGLV